MRNYKELMVTIFLAGALFSLAAASLKKSAVDDKRLTCAMHLQKIHTMTLAYENDYNTLPPANIPGKTWRFWSDCLSQYTDNMLVFCCPSDPRAEKLFEQENPLFNFASSKILSYGMNYFLTGSSADVKKVSVGKLELLKNPGSLILYAESKIPHILLSRYLEEDALFNHEENMNIVFADGHIELWDKNKFMKDETSGKKEINMIFWRWK